MNKMKSLTSIFEEVLNKEPEWKTKSVKEPSFKIKPSMVGSKCFRQVYYSSAGVPEDYPFPLSGKKRMKLGEAIHNMLHDVFSEAKILVDYYNEDGTKRKDPNGKDDLEFPISSIELFIKKGKIDAVYIIDGELWIGEYKSINQKGFLELMGPKQDHMIQAIIYFYVFNQLLKEGKFKHIKELDGFEKAKGIKFLYINKDDTEFKEYLVTNTDYVFEQVVEKIMTIKHHYDNKILPPKTPNYCNSCNWRDKCKRNYNIS